MFKMPRRIADLPLMCAPPIAGAVKPEEVIAVDSDQVDKPAIVMRGSRPFSPPA